MSGNQLWQAIKRLNWVKAKCRKGSVSAAMIRRLERRVDDEAAKVAEIFQRAWGEKALERIEGLANERPTKPQSFEK